MNLSLKNRIVLYILLSLVLKFKLYYVISSTFVSINVCSMFLRRYMIFFFYHFFTFGHSYPILYYKGHIIKYIFQIV